MSESSITEMSLEERVTRIEGFLTDVADTLNANSKVIGTLLDALGVVVHDKEGKLLMAVAIPNDPKIAGGFLSRIIRDVAEIKKQLPQQGIILATKIPR